MSRKKNNNTKRPRKPRARKSAKQLKTTNSRTTKSGLAPAMRMPTVVRSQQSSTKKMSKMAIVHQVCAITDPFCIHAKNAKYPDGKGIGSLPMQLRGTQNITTGTTALQSQGGACYVFTGSLPFCFNGSNDANTSPGNWRLSAVNQNPFAATNFTSYADKYRVVSWGIIIRSIVPATTAQGFLTVSRLNDFPAISTDQPVGSMIGVEVKNYPIVPGMEIHVTGLRVGADSERFVSLDTSTTDNIGWDTIKLELTGAATADSVKVLNVEIVFNVEFTLLLANQALSQFVTPPKPANNTVLQASAKMQSSVSTIMDAGSSKVGSFLEKAASSALDDIISSGFALLGL